MKKFIAFIAALPFYLHAAPDAQINLTIEGVHSNKGHVLVSVFDKADGFPMKPKKSVRVARMAAKDGILTKAFRGLKPGEYAIAMIHDENDNLKLDDNGKGVPTEGFGFSNNPKADGGPVAYESAKFTLKPGVAEIKVTTTYVEKKD